MNPGKKLEAVAIVVPLTISIFVGITVGLASESLITPVTVDVSSTSKAKNILQVENLKINLTDPQKKLSTDLLQLINSDYLPKSQTRETHELQMESLGQFRSASSVSTRAEGRLADDLVYVYIYLKPSAGTQTLEPYVWEITDRDEENHLAVAWVGVKDLEALASLETVRAIRTVMPPLVTTGSKTTEGDAIHRTSYVRALYSQGGAGVKVGIISDGVDHWTTARNSGDLPADLTVLSNAVGGDEGTAMLEIVHDMVPNAKLYFHDCGTNTIAFNNAIDALVAAGCDIICDDISWIIEPFFEDGIVASHLKSLLASNDFIYVSSAGNSAYEHYQGDYYPLDMTTFHDFSQGISPTPFLYLSMPAGSRVRIVLQWNDKFGASGNDYDLYLYNIGTGTIVAGSVIIQDGNDDPLEFISYTAPGTYDFAIIVDKYSGVGRTLEVYIYPENGAGVYTNNINPADSIFGHPAVPDVIAVGAIDASDPGNDDIEPFSSQGPVTITYPTPETRAKPNLCGIDGVTVTGAGGFYVPFYGTSAAAPHIAAIAAQLWGAFPTNTSDEIRTHLYDSAVDLGSAGYDNVFGYGRADARRAYEMIVPQPPQVRVTDTPAVTVVPGETYTSYNITFTVNRSDSSWTNLSWLNITGMNQSLSNPGDISAIRNISVVLNTTGENIVNYARSTSLPALDWPITLNLSNKGIGNDTTNTTVNLSIYLTLNTSGLTDGANIALNASLYAWANAASPWFWGSANNTNDPAPERIEVLDTRAGVSNTTAWEGDMNVLCANVTIIPGNRTVPSYLRAITFNTTATTTLNAACIERFALWNDTNANERFDAGDTLIAATSPTDGVNVTFYLSALPLANRTIPAGVNGTFFLTMNATRPGSYQAIIHAQNITINQSGSDAGNTGNSTVTAGFTTLTINPIPKVTGIYDADGANSVVPGATYIAYNFTYRDGNNTLGTNLTWFNLTGWNTSIISSNVTFTDILNITLWNTTIPANPVYIGHTSSPAGFNISINLSNYWVPQNNTANITITISLNTGGLVDGEQIAFNASLTYIANATSSVWNRTVEERANDPAAERIEVLEATAGASRTIAWEGDPNVLCANVTIVPGNRTVTSYLKAITFNTTADSTLNAAYIECFALWNDTNADEIFDPAADALITTISTPGGVNVTFDLTALPLENRTIPEGANGRFFLTMNITETAHTGRYQAQILAQKIVLNQSSSSGGGGGNGGGGGLGIIEGNTGNDSATIGFTLLWIDPVDVRVYDGPKEYVRANETYVAYTITYQENTTDVGGAHLTWFNVTGMTLSVPNLCDISTITTVSVLNSTSGTYLGNATRLSTSPYFTVNLDNTEVADNGTYDLTILVSLNTSPNLIQGQNISLTARLYDDETHNLSADDPAPETIDMIAPTVTAHSPIGTGVSITTSVSVTFSEPMDLLTINTTTFTLDSVTGTVTYDAGTRTATFDPTSNLDYSKTYTAIITTGATDLAGNSLAESYSWSFTTEAAPTQPVRGAGGGGGGGGGAPLTFPNIPVDPATGRVTSITTLSADGATLTIPAGAILKDAAGKPLSRITSGYLPTIAEQIGAISAYDLGPAGATFTPPIDLVIAYDPAKLSTGFSESDLVIRMWDGTAWVDLETSVNTVVHTATAKVAHFTLFGLFAVPHAAPAPAPTPSVTPEATPEITPTPAQPRQMPGGIVVVPLALAAALIIVAVAYLMLKKGIIKPKMREKK